jgi:hypothetical protein
VDGLVSWVTDVTSDDNTISQSELHSAQIDYDPTGNITGLAPGSTNRLLSYAVRRGSDGEDAHDWSPDGTRLAYNELIGGAWRLAVLDRATGQTLRLTEGQEPVWSPDGTG